MDMQFAAGTRHRQGHEKFGTQRSFFVDAAIARTLIGADDGTFEHGLFRARFSFNAFRLNCVSVSGRRSQKKGRKGRNEGLRGQHCQLRRVANFCN